jgi:hypothetical protein
VVRLCSVVLTVSEPLYSSAIASQLTP